MRRADSPRRLAGLALALLALGPSVAAQEQGHPGRRGPRVERLEKHWQDLPDEERRVLRERLQRFRDLPDEDRRAVLERARVLREHEREWRDHMPPPLRRELEELPPDRRRERWQEHLRERFRARGHELRSEMPPHVREQLEKAPPPVRRHLFEELRRRHGGDGPGLGPPPLPPGEWERLPPEERLERAREHFRRRHHDRKGPPPEGRRFPEGGGLPPGGRRPPRRP
jgi:hypothetical protein